MHMHAINTSSHSISFFNELQIVVYVVVCLESIPLVHLANVKIKLINANGKFEVKE